MPRSKVGSLDHKDVYVPKGYSLVKTSGKDWKELWRKPGTDYVIYSCGGMFYVVSYKGLSPNKNVVLKTHIYEEFWGLNSALSYVEQQIKKKK